VNSHGARGFIKMKKILFIMTTILVLSGCGIKRPVAEVRSQPKLDIEEKWTSGAGSEEDILSDWWDSFRDEDLSSLVSRALENNWDLKAAAQRLDAAVIQARMATTGKMPTVAAGLNSSESRRNFVGMPFPGAEDKVISNTSFNSGVSLDVSWEPDIWGKFSAQEIGAAADMEAVRADVRAARLSLVAQVSKVWFSIIEARQQLDLAERSLESYRETANKLKLRYEMGLQGSLDYRLSLSSVSGAEYSLEQRKQSLLTLTRQLEILLGEYPDGELATRDTIPGLPGLPAAGVPSQLVSRRPDLVSLEKTMLSAGAGWAEAKTALYPSFNLTGSMGTSTDNFLKILNPEYFIWSLAGSIVQPIFNGGRLRAQVDLQDALAGQAASNWASAVLKAFQEVETAMDSEVFLAEQENALAEAARQSTAALNLAQKQYEGGLTAFVTVLESQRRSLDSESSLLTIRRQKLDARVDLHLALGGGLEDREFEGKDEEAVL
jgi:outer membrane protein, multidrug efflux system